MALFPDMSVIYEVGYLSPLVEERTVDAQMKSLLP